MSEPVQLDFYFCPTCPWCWRTALWARRIAGHGQVDISWLIFSLALINKDNPRYVTDPGALKKRLRTESLFVAARKHGGNAAAEALYMTFGEARHGRGEEVTEDMLRSALTSAGLPASLLDQVADDPSFIEELTAEHTQAVEDLGVFGVPTLRLQGSEIAVFGPVIDPIPSGPQALELWEHTLWVLRQPFLWEFKRERSFQPGPQPLI